MQSHRSKLRGQLDALAHELKAAQEAKRNCDLRLAELGEEVRKLRTAIAFARVHIGRCERDAAMIKVIDTELGEALRDA